MVKERKRIAPELKAKIMSELFKPGYTARQLAQAYGISRCTVNSWRGAYRHKTGAAEADGHKARPESDSGSRFVELSVRETKRSGLEKASLIFSDFSISIEGRIKSSRICEVLKVLMEV